MPRLKLRSKPFYDHRQIEGHTRFRHKFSPHYDRFYDRRSEGPGPSDGSHRQQGHANHREREHRSNKNRIAPPRNRVEEVARTLPSSRNSRHSSDHQEDSWDEDREETPPLSKPAKPAKGSKASAKRASSYQPSSGSASPSAPRKDPASVRNLQDRVEELDNQNQVIISKLNEIGSSIDHLCARANESVVVGLQTTLNKVEEKLSTMDEKRTSGTSPSVNESLIKIYRSGVKSQKSSWKRFELSLTSSVTTAVTETVLKALGERSGMELGRKPEQQNSCVPLGPENCGNDSQTAIRNKISKDCGITQEESEDDHVSKQTSLEGRHSDPDTEQQVDPTERDDLDWLLSGLPLSVLRDGGPSVSSRAESACSTDPNSPSEYDGYQTH